MRFAPANTVGRLLSEITGNPASLTIRIVDYPGEWLLDLPAAGAKLRRVVARHAAVCCAKASAPRSAASFSRFSGSTGPSEVASEEVAKQAHDLYCAYLVKARDRHGLSFLQPGRFLCPGVARRCALSVVRAARRARADGMFAPHTLGALMAERFETYKREAVAPFYHDHFRHYSRQIVLVDVLRALLAGRDAFDDTRLALDAILESFRYGHGGILSKLLLGPHIDKVLFAATKADHVPDIQRDHLAALLRNMAAFPAIEVKSSNAQFEVTALASVISTAEDTQEIDGQRLQVVVGRPVGSSEAGEILRRQRSDPSAARRMPGARRSSTCRCSSRPPSIHRRSTGSRTSISTWRSNSCWETGCDDRSIRPPARRSPRA